MSLPKLNVYNTKLTNHWQTPPDLYRKLDKEFHFQLDPCPLLGENREESGLEKEWSSCNFVNPPYSNVEPWARKCAYERQKGNTSVLKPSKVGWQPMSVLS